LTVALYSIGNISARIENDNGLNAELISPKRTLKMTREVKESK